MEEAKPIEKRLDVYKDTPIRLLGYANEVGEAFRSNIKVKYVHLSYAIATVYCLADTADKTVESFKDERTTHKETVIKGVDTLLWQLLASVVVPGYTINRICTVSRYILKKSDRIPAKVRLRLIPLIGLASIPVIIKPIDHAIDYLMDNSFRKYF